MTGSITSTDAYCTQNHTTDIYFRTDGNNKIASGHLMRCLAIARACVRMGLRTAFIVSDEQSLTLLQERFTVPHEFETYCMDSDYTRLPQEIPTLLTCIRWNTVHASNNPKPWIFVDSYYADPSYLQTLRQYFRVAYLDDLRQFDCPVDLVINYDTDKDCRYYAVADRRLLGAQYTPLREQFRTPSYEVRTKAAHVLLSTGGTDPYGVAECLLNAVYARPAETLSSLHYHILTGRMNTRYDALVALARLHPTIHIHEGVSDVVSLMASCDLAVCAGGTTLCELCAVGVPTISYLMAENQRTAVVTYSELGLIPYAGDIRFTKSDTSLSPDDIGITQENTTFFSSDQFTINSSVLSRILSFMTLMSQNFSARTESSQKMRAFLDGTGADLIAGELLS